MPNTGSQPSVRAGAATARRCGRVTHVDLLTVVLSAMLCWASYTLSIWHNSRGAADSSVLGLVGGGTVCGDADEELDFEARHAAEDAGLSVSSGSANSMGRRALRAAGEAPAAAGTTSRYRGPFPWPASRGVVWAGNSARGAEIAAAAGNRWARVDGDMLRFTDAGAVRAYSDFVLGLIPAPPVRTALDVGAMHGGSWTTEMLSRGVLTVSMAAPWGASDGAALVELALERGVPAMLAATTGAPSRRLPYPPGAFDMAHCGRCLVPCHHHGGRFLMEIDRVLRQGGYWVHSGGPRNGTQERAAIEAAAASMCWRSVADQNGVTVWQKPASHVGCEAASSPRFCTGQNREDKWDGGTEPCITPIQEGAAPPREATAVEAIRHDSGTWKRRVARYKAVATQLGQKGRLRNLIDMNAHLGGFAAALADDPVWVMNVVPAAGGGDTDTDTFAAIYDRGLIGAYHDWCEPLPTPAMSYDLLHADSLFTLYRDRCDTEGILLEMDRILRPGRSMIIRDDVAILAKIKNFVTDQMRWDVQIVDGENGSGDREKILFAAKTCCNDEDRDEEQ